MALKLIDLHFWKQNIEQKIEKFDKLEKISLASHQLVGTQTV